MIDFWLGLGLFTAGAVVGASLGAFIMAAFQLNRRRDD
jgi:hypothetical protein